VVVVRTSAEERSEDLATTLLSAVHEAVARPRTAAVDLLLPDIDDLLGALERAAPGHAIGISALARLGDPHVSARQADSLSQVSVHTGRPVQAEEGGATQLLLQLGPPDLLSSYSDAVLAPLDALEARERRELLHTLEEWLRANGAWEAAAAALSVHRNTVRNRIARVGGLLGRPLDADRRMELWLALQARAAVLRAPLRPPGDDGDAGRRP
jgi:purine catabolism regulator